MARNKNFEALFDRTRSSAEILKEQEQEGTVPVDEIRNWADFFAGQFGGELTHPRNASVLMKWHMPDYYIGNPSNVDAHIPVMSVIEDMNGEVWMCYLSNPTEVHWKFLLLKPHRETLLKYIRGEVDLLSVYRTTPMFYISTPDMEHDLLPVEPKDLSEELIPAEGATYNPNIWFDTADMYYGMNSAPYTRIVEFANQGRFYWF